MPRGPAVVILAAAGCQNGGMDLLIGTRNGLYRLGEAAPLYLAGSRIQAIAPDDGSYWVVHGDGDVSHLDASGSVQLRLHSDRRLNCVLAADDGVLLGAAEATLLALGPDGNAGRDEAFDATPGRSTWHTPWGGPPDVRSMARTADGAVLVNVHVGGVVRRRPGEAWNPSMEVNADAHEVAAHPTDGSVAAAATAIGLATTSDGADTWSFHTEGLTATYSRAVAVSEDRLFFSVADSHAGRNSKLYRAGLDGSNIEHCTVGLPEPFTSHINTGCLVARGKLVVAGDPDGTIYASEDAGDTWESVGRVGAAVTCLTL